MTDRYTKVLLTVIASCLVIMVVRETPFVNKALAQSGPLHVIVDQVGMYAFQYVTVPVHVER